MPSFPALPFLTIPLNLNPTYENGQNVAPTHPPGTSFAPCSTSPRTFYEIELINDVECVADDPQKVVKVIASHGKTGEQIELSYSGSRVVGNGSFGIVFQAKLSPESADGGDGDVAIKKVLQDKRFKVRFGSCSCLARY